MMEGIWRMEYSVESREYGRVDMLKKFGEILIVAILVAGVVGAFLRISGAIPIAVTQTQKQSTFDVTGEGKVVVPPDQAQIVLGLQQEGTNVKQLQEQVDVTMRQLSQQLKALGIEEKDLKTVGYQVYDSYSPDSSARRYAVSSSVQVTIRDLSRASEVVDLIGPLGLTQSGGLTFSLSDELREKTVRAAREEAITEAKKKATELAGLAGMQLGRIVNVAESSNGMPQPYTLRAEVAKDTGAGSTPAQIEPGSSEISVSVTVSYETR